METVKVNAKNFPPIFEDWKVTVKDYGLRLKDVPVVLSGTIDSTQATQWLETASKLYRPNMINRLLHQVSALGAKDIRTLMAHERNEYFPSDSVGELYNRKLLQTIVAPNGPSLERERILTNVTRSMLLSRYGLERNHGMEKVMASTDPSRDANWLIGNPGMIGIKGKDNFIYDIQFCSNTTEIDQGDVIRLHYYDLVANNIGEQPKHLSVVKVAIDPQFADSLVVMSRLSKNAEQMIANLATDFSDLPENKVKIQVHQIEKKPELYEEIITTGQKHWSQILAGNIPQVKIDPPLILEGDRKSIYIDKAKSFLAASQTSKAAEAARLEAVDAFIQSMRGYDISSNFKPPYEGALLRKYDFFDAEAAAAYLEKDLGIDPAHIRSQEINVELLKQAFVTMGGDLNSFIENGAPDKKSIETVAEQIGFDLSSFRKRQMRAIVNPKTRGPIHDAIKGIKNELSESINDLNSKTAKSAIMDNKNLLPSDVKTSHRQASMKV